MTRALMILLLFASAASPAQEPEPWLRVDVLVFRQALAASAYFDEAWRHQPLALGGSVDLLEPRALTAASIYAYEDGDTLLARQADALDRNGRYQLLVRRSWLVPPLSRSQAPRLRVRDGIGYALVEPPMPTGGFDWSAADFTPISVGAPAILLDRLDGTLSVYRERYLHVALDLNLVEPLAGIFPAGTDLDGRAEYVRTDVHSYRLSARRRVKTEQLHYFDHPRFGALVQLHWIPADELPPELTAPPLPEAP